MMWLRGPCIKSLRSHDVAKWTIIRSKMSHDVAEWNMYNEPNVI